MNWWHISHYSTIFNAGEMVYKKVTLDGILDNLKMYLMCSLSKVPDDFQNVWKYNNNDAGWSIHQIRTRVSDKKPNQI